MSVILFIVIILVLIVGHELGHFVVGKLVRMKVLEFGIGFPPRLWGRQVGETLYSVNALPFGGFVRIFGEDESERYEERAFARQSKWAQAATLFAGVFMNIVLGFIAFFLAFSLGVPAVIDETNAGTVTDARVVVAQVMPGSPAADVGLMTGDRVVAIGHNDQVATVTQTSEIPAAIARNPDPVTLVIQRSGEEQTLTVAPVAGLIPEDPQRLGIGIASVLVGTKQLGLGAALVEAAVQTGTGLVSVAVGLVTLIGSALALSADLTDISGPVGIAGLVGDASAFGAGQVLALAAIISLNLAVLNLLPFPALDGGRLAMLAYETLRGRAIRQATAQMINAVGFIVLICLMLVVTFSDITKLL